MSLMAEQLEMRRKGITGTDIGAICGLSEHRTPLDVWRDKVGQSEPVITTAAMKRGIYLEDGIRRWYADEVGAASVREVGTMVHPSEPRIMATPDGIAIFAIEVVPERFRAERVGLEIKAPGIHAESGWGQPGTDQVPQAYLCQAVFEMAVLDVERLDFAALLGGELRIFPVKRNRKVEGHLIERALAFWRDHVEAGKPPAPMWRPRDAEWLANTFPKETAPAREWQALTALEQADVAQWLAAHAEEATAKRTKGEYEARVKLALGGASGIVALPPELGVKRVDWEANEGGAVAWKKVAEAVRDGAKWEEAVKANTGTPARPLVPRRIKNREE